MLLCGIGEVEPGMVLGASVTHPRKPATELLRVGVELDAGLIGRLEGLGVWQVWVRLDVTGDLDAAVANDLCRARTAVFERMRGDYAAQRAQPVSAAQVQSYRQALGELVVELTGNRKYARLTDRLYAAEDELFNHSAHVAFLSMLIGLELQTYIADQRKRLSASQACDMVALGLAAMFHDIGKLALKPPVNEYHEAHEAAGPGGEGKAAERPKDYERHPLIAYEMLGQNSLPASARQAVLNHHQRFDGGGWPDLAEVTRHRCGTQRGTQVHVFSRIIAAANVLDNLLIEPGGRRRPAAAALRDFAGPRFDGWFDPVVRDLVLRRVSPFPIGASVKLSDGRSGVVVGPNLHQPCRPTVRILPDDMRRAEAESGKLVELGSHRGVHIVRCAGEHVEPYLYELPGGSGGWAAGAA